MIIKFPSKWSRTQHFLTGSAATRADPQDLNYLEVKVRRHVVVLLAEEGGAVVGRLDDVGDVALGVDDADLLVRRLCVRLEEQGVLVDQHPQAAKTNS